MTSNLSGADGSNIPCAMLEEHRIVDTIFMPCGDGTCIYLHAFLEHFSECIESKCPHYSIDTVEALRYELVKFINNSEAHRKLFIMLDRVVGTYKFFKKPETDGSNTSLPVANGYLTQADQFLFLRNIIVDLLVSDLHIVMDMLQLNEKFRSWPKDKQIMAVVRINREAMQGLIREVTDKNGDF